MKKCWADPNVHCECTNRAGKVHETHIAHGQRMWPTWVDSTTDGGTEVAPTVHKYGHFCPTVERCTHARTDYRNHGGTRVCLDCGAWWDSLRQNWQPAAKLTESVSCAARDHHTDPHTNTGDVSDAGSDALAHCSEPLADVEKYRGSCRECVTIAAEESDSDNSVVNDSLTPEWISEEGTVQAHYEPSADGVHIEEAAFDRETGEVETLHLWLSREELESFLALFPELRNATASGPEMQRTAAEAPRDIIGTADLTSGKERTTKSSPSCAERPGRWAVDVKCRDCHYREEGTCTNPDAEAYECEVEEWYGCERWSGRHPDCQTVRGKCHSVAGSANGMTATTCKATACVSSNAHVSQTGNSGVPENAEDVEKWVFGPRNQHHGSGEVGVAVAPSVVARSGAGSSPVPPSIPLAEQVAVFEQYARDAVDLLPRYIRERAALIIDREHDRMTGIGADEYQDASFHLTIDELHDELQQELCDAVFYAAVLLYQMDRLRKALP